MFSRSADRASLGRRRSRSNDLRRDELFDLRPHRYHHELGDLERDELGIDDEQLEWRRCHGLRWIHR